MSSSRSLRRRPARRGPSFRFSGAVDRLPLDWRTGLFLAMTAAVFLLGGASRAAVLAQPLLRTLSFAVLIALVLAADLDWRRHRFVAAMLAACVALPLVQLVPLPPAVWSMMPGREPFTYLGPLIGGQPWRPLALVPDATVNALFSLVVPVAFFAASLALPPERRGIAVPAFLAGVTASALVALFQLGDARLDNPLINETPGVASGLLANRNHQALLLAIGLLLVPAWLAGEAKRSAGRLLAAGLLATWFALMILAAGSRAGLAWGALALLAAAWPARTLLADSRGGRAGRRGRRRRWDAIAAAVVLAALLVGYAAMSGQGRAVQRLFAQEDVADLRVRALPTIWAMVREYFPVGGGLGGFDPLFRMHEPLALLKPTYFNHAHDDFLEIAMDAGALGVVLILAVLVWWVGRVRALWATRTGPRVAWLGGAAIALIAAASIVDYPLRTPLFMVLLVQAALWLDAPGVTGGGRSLRSRL